ncbi:hypothetical protein [Variovorax sp. WS11]|nr:hypothetical protein [Variovorax sp. WS11]
MVRIDREGLHAHAPSGRSEPEELFTKGKNRRLLDFQQSLSN